MNIPTCEGENPRINTGSCLIINDHISDNTNFNSHINDIKDTVAEPEVVEVINDKNTEQGNMNANLKVLVNNVAEAEANVVSDIKVYNQNVVLSKDPHARKINDICNY